MTDNKKTENMKIIVISYSLTGNNEALAKRIASGFSAKHVSISETKPRTNFTTILDLLFNRTPHVNPIVNNVEGYDLVIFVGPVWMGQVATPLRAYFRNLKTRLGKYAFISISGGANGSNPQLAEDLKKRLGKEPLALIDLHIADLLPTHPKPTRKDTMAYHLKERDIKNLTDKVIKTLEEKMAMTVTH